MCISIAITIRLCCMSVAKRVTGDARYHSPLAHLRSSLRNNVGFAKFSSNQHNTRNRRTKKTKNKKNRNQNETKWVRIVKLSDWHTCIRDSLKMLSLYTRKIFDSHTQWCTARLPILLSLTCSSSLSPSLSLFVVRCRHPSFSSNEFSLMRLYGAAAAQRWTTTTATTTATFK